MKIHSVYAKNFGSYKELDFRPSENGLTLIHGATGSGKSTLPDIISWTLFGVTAKDGNADDVRSWGTPDEDTIGEVYVDDITVVRTRGAKNDLYWTGPDGLPTRGTDLCDSQRQLSLHLGVDGALFVLCCGSAENGAAQFFSSSAKARREVLERVTDLSLPKTLSDKAAAAKKELKALVKPLNSRLDHLRGSLDNATLNLVRLTKQSREWERENQLAQTRLEQDLANDAKIKEGRVKALQTKSEAWDTFNASETAKVAAKWAKVGTHLEEAQKTSDPCVTCGVSKGAEAVAKLKGDLRVLRAEHKALTSAVNPHAEPLAAALAALSTPSVPASYVPKGNPHEKYLSDVRARVLTLEADLAGVESQVADYERQFSALDQLYEMSFALRGYLLQTAVKTIENQTNRSLETHFDSEFRVSFDASDGDTISVSITKDGYECSYRQLSKGQRQLLKLCFSVSVMEAAANSSGVHIGQIFLDEALDGLDEALKIKAFGLFDELSQKHDSVFVIEHSAAFQELFENRYHVTIVGDHSHIDKC